MPLVSVVIPTYQHAATVVETLESVFAQTFDDAEVIVVNDGSPDETAAALAPYAADGRIRLVEQPNAGQGAARNRGIALATGDFVALLDDDDLWPADKLAWQLDALTRQPDAVLVYGYCEAFGGHARWRTPPTPGPAGRVKRAFLANNPITSPGQTLIRRDALARLGGFDPMIRGADDWDLYLRLADLGPFAYEDRLALRYRIHGGSASRDVAAMRRECLKVCRKHVGPDARADRHFAEDRDACRAFVDSYCASTKMTVAGESIVAGARGRAMAALAGAAWYRPALARQRDYWRMVRRALAATRGTS